MDLRVQEWYLKILLRLLEEDKPCMVLRTLESLKYFSWRLIFYHKTKAGRLRLGFCPI